MWQVPIGILVVVVLHIVPRMMSRPNEEVLLVMVCTRFAHVLVIYSLIPPSLKGPATSRLPRFCSPCLYQLSLVKDISLVDI